MGRHLRCPTLRRPTVSVVLPCYNYGHYLHDAVGSVLSQEHVDADVVIVDDASTDNNAEVAQALADAQDRVHLIGIRRTEGTSRTYNDGLATVSGEYTVLLSADDLLTPGALGRAVQLMEAEPGVGLVYGHPVSFTSTPPTARACPELDRMGRSGMDRRALQTSAKLHELARGRHAGIGAARHR